MVDFHGLMRLGDLANEIAVVAIAIVVAVVLHEVAHGATAWACGDPTAARRGRLTLNPLRHIDPVGTLLVPAVLVVLALFGGPGIVFGWARPVPVDFRRLRRPRRDTVLVALAGPGVNLLLAGAAALGLAWLGRLGDGDTFLMRLAATTIQVNCVLAVFNLLPIPPLDGGRALTAVLPAGPARAFARLENLGYVMVLLIMLNTDVVGRMVRPLIQLFLRLAV